MSRISRRGFLGGAVAGIASMSQARAEAPPEDPRAEGPEAPPAPQAPSPGSDEVAVTFRCNGQDHSQVVAGHTSALDVIRTGVGLTGAKLGCGAGTCGACTVLVDGEPQVTCLLPATSLADREITTVEAIGKGTASADLHPIQRAFLAADALQCGYCTPGYIVEAAAFHDRWRAEHGTTEPSRDDIAAALAGHLCRCGAYTAIYAAVAAACRGDHDTDQVEYARVDGPAKVTGAAKYTVDVQLEGMLEGHIVRSPVAHGILRSIDLSAASAMPGVVAVHRLVPDDGRIRFVGQEIAAIAAVDADTARAAVRQVALDIEALPAVITIDDAQKAGAPVLYPDRKARKTIPNASEGPLLGASWDGNTRGPFSASALMRPRRARKGIDDAAKAGSLVADTWEAHVQCHTTLEPHAAVARFDAGRLEVWASTQSCAHLAEDLAQRFKLKDEVVVHAEYVGGGFGAKVGLQMETLVAVELARAAGAPVRVALSREEELITGGFRPGQRVEMAVAMSVNGSLMGISHQSVNDSGVAVGHLSGILTRVMYPSPKKDLDDFDVVTNTPPGKPFRGPGGPATFFALEGAIDQLAHDTGEDPIEVRRRWDPNVPRLKLYDWIETLDAWNDRGPVGQDTGRYRRGVGLASGGWYHFFDPHTQLELEAGPAGFVARTACQDMGNGTRALIAAAVGQRLGVPATAIDVAIGDSRAVHGPISAGSRTASSLTPAAEDAADQLIEAMVDLAEAKGLGSVPVAGGVTSGNGSVVPWSEILQGEAPIRTVGRRRRDYKAAVLPFAIEQIKLGRVFAGVVNLTEVEVDTRLGRVTAREAWVGVGVGRIVCPPVARSQMEGATVQGISYALYEQRHLDPSTGHLLTHGLDDYRIAGIGDIPPIHVHFEEAGFEHVRGGAVGIGEIGSVAVPASIANAVFHATGIRPRRLPLNPRYALEGLA